MPLRDDARQKLLATQRTRFDIAREVVDAARLDIAIVAVAVRWPVVVAVADAFEHSSVDRKLSDAVAAVHRFATRFTDRTGHQPMVSRLTCASVQE